MKRPTKASALPLARVAARPSAPVGERFIEHCHPTERERAPGSHWLHEIKVDSYRAQLHLRDGKATVYSRRGHDWTEQFSTIARAAERLRVKNAVLDGEVIVQDAAGMADYHALRSELARKNSDRLTYYAFDLLFLGGEVLRSRPLRERKRRLQQLSGLYITTADPRQRAGKLFIDYLRNGRGTTAVGAYSPRALPGLPIAAPVTWKDVEKDIGSDAFSMRRPLRSRRARR